MIEINLHPGGPKRKKRAGGGGAPKLPGLPTFDRMTMFVVAAWIIGPALGLWLYFGVQGDRSRTQVALDQAVADSTRYARLIATQNSLRARQDTIAQKLAIIQEIDAGRYIWPHLMDEISGALPPYTWLHTIDQVSRGTQPQFQIQGRTGSLPALTRFMDALEASPFIRNVQLVGSEMAQVGGDPNKVVNNFVLTGAYEIPPLEVIETVPLFEGMVADSAAVASAEASNGTGTP
ncbi:MAG TPA: PilN domain-containing protein [Longimicrobiales bacterium]|nr:PilN domain-containing protein [Longimicrobiales bacterium]